MKYYLIILSFIIGFASFSQNTISQVLKSQNKSKVAYIKIDQLKDKNNYLFFDAREPREYNISHLEKAVCVGYDKFDSKQIREKYKNLNDTIVVYCSIGIRSGTVGDKLKKMGYKNVYNLYGGIFEWKNQDKEVVDNNGNPTQKVHTFSKEWSKYLLKGEKYFEKEKIK
jgi:rhodanese-related sulfurtransferase